MSRIVHLGLGAFFRAHGAIYTQEAGGWRICGVSLRSAGTRDVLKGQGWAYTAACLNGDTLEAQRIEVLEEVLVAPEDPVAVLERMADASTQIVSLTVTEKGYCHLPGTGRLYAEHPEVQAELASGRPTSAVGYIVAALGRRRAAGLRPFTVLSLDNLPGNGRVARAVVLDFARQTDAALAEWIEAEGAFPSTMVDRIVPATTAEAVEALAVATGVRDAGMVQHEPFRQWVIEDAFVGDVRPAWESAGAQIVADVAPYEDVKLRMLNGAHSALAYLGVLAGRETVYEAITDATLGGFIDRLWRDALIPSIAPPEGLDLASYADQLRARFANPGIRHLTAQIAMDGSQKLPQRILAPMADAMAGGFDTGLFETVLAAWIHYLGGRTDAGVTYRVSDPLAEVLQQALAGCDSPAARVEAVFDLAPVFGSYPMERVTAGVTDKLAAFETMGTLAALAAEA